MTSTDSLVLGVAFAELRTYIKVKKNKKTVLAKITETGPNQLVFMSWVLDFYVSYFILLSILVSLNCSLEYIRLIFDEMQLPSSCNVESHFFCLFEKKKLLFINLKDYIDENDYVSSQPLQSEKMNYLYPKNRISGYRHHKPIRHKL